VVDRLGLCSAVPLAEPSVPSVPKAGTSRPSEPTEQKKLGKDLRRGSTWVLMGYVGGQALRLASNLVLWRLLYPEAFGLMALVNTFLSGLQMFSDVGIAPSIVQSKQGDEPDYLNTAWTIQALRGLTLFVIACLAARTVAHFYEAPDLTGLIPMVGLVSIFAGFISTKLVTAKRHVALGRLTILELASQALGIAIMIPIAYATKSVWALAIGSVATSVAKLVLSHTFLPGVRNQFRWHAPSARALLHFGRWVFLSTLLTFAVLQSDRLIFGKLVTLEMLGVYSIATVWAAIPTQVLSQVSSSVVFPLLSRVHNAGGNFAAALRQTRTPWLALAGWMVACLAAGGPSLVHFFYDERAKAAEWMLQILAVGAWFVSLESPNRMALLAQGRPLWMSVDSGAKLVAMAVLIPLGWFEFGFPGAVAGFAGAEAFPYIASLVGLSRVGISGLLVDVLLSGFVLGTTAAGSAVRRMLEALLADADLPRRMRALVEGGGVFLVVSAAWGLAFLAYRKSSRAKAVVDAPTSKS
jgi:O-antigen/teichoic acid export membrane protein